MIPIVAISDAKQAFALATLFVNLMETKAKETVYELNALVAPDFTDEDVAKIKSLEHSYQDCKINIIKMDNRFDHIKNGIGYIANCRAYKMCMADMFPQYDKILYLDTDMLVFEDLSPLYNTDMSDNYIGGVFSIDHYLNRRELIEKLNIPDMTDYVNAGMLLMNLAEIRKNRIEEKLQALIGSYNDSVDQHIFNKVCYGHIKHLPFKYNVFKSSEWMYDNKEALVCMTGEELDEIINSPAIYHYTGKEKPWNTLKIKYGVRWIWYYKKTAYKDLKLILAEVKKIETTTPQKVKMRLIDYVFSIKKYKKQGKSFKQLTILGLKLKLQKNK